MSDRIAELEVGLVLVATVGAVWWLWKGPGAGLLSGNNALTKNATNAAGERVTAYQGAGPVGTIGAAANAASGGVLASIGQWIGQKAADLFLPDPMASTAASTAKYHTAGNLPDSGGWDDNAAADAAYMVPAVPGN